MGRRYGYGGFPEYPEGLKAGAPYRVLAGTGMQEQGVTGPVVEGELVEVDPPRRFSQTWRLIMDEATAAEPFTRVSYDIEPQDGGVTRLTVTHELEGAPRTAAMVSGAHRRPAPAAAGPGSSATSRRCWRPALRSRAECRLACCGAPPGRRGRRGPHRRLH